MHRQHRLARTAFEEDEFARLGSADGGTERTADLEVRRKSN